MPGGDLGARAAREDLEQPEVIHVLMGEHDQLEVLDPVTELAPEPVSSSSSDLPEFGPVSTSVSGSSSIR